MVDERRLYESAQLRNAQSARTWARTPTVCRLSTAATIAVRDVERGMARELVEVARVDGRDRRSRLRPAHNTSRLEIFDAIGRS